MTSDELKTLTSIYEDIRHSRGPVPDGVLLKNGIDRFKKFLSMSANKRVENLLDRLEAVETVIGGTSVPSREELDCASQELGWVLMQFRHT